jgi:hypothetical protein
MELLWQRLQKLLSQIAFGQQNPQRLQRMQAFCGIQGMCLYVKMRAVKVASAMFYHRQDISTIPVAYWCIEVPMD